MRIALSVTHAELRVVKVSKFGRSKEAFSWLLDLCLLLKKNQQSSISVKTFCKQNKQKPVLFKQGFTAILNIIMPDV